MEFAYGARTRWQFQPILSVVSALLCIGVAAFSYRYVAAIGPVPPVVAQNVLKDPWLLVHVLGSATALLVVPVQFLARLRQRAPTVHRWTGRVYVAGCFVGGISGLYLAFGLSTGPISSMGFGSLAIASLVTTWLGWRAAVTKRFAEHRAWMIRSFALTFAAVTLRIYIPIALALPIAFTAGYQFISFACWVPNIIIAEAFLLGKFRKSRG